MGFTDWLNRMLGRTRKRDISGLSQTSGDAVEELVDLRGGPLKNGQRRLALRDKRLLPKPARVRGALRIGKRPKVMSAAESTRLFAGTLRTKNRNYRDLLADENQLKRYGLPVWRTEEDLAKALGISLKELWFFAIHREKEQRPHYVMFAIPKRSGGKRVIMAPKRRLKAIQRRLNQLMVSKFPLSDNAHGFRKNRNIKTGAEPHVGKNVLLHLDLENFFPTITFARVRGLLIAYGYSFPVASTLAVLMTEAERQPVAVDGKIFHVPVTDRHCVQGAPTSPGISNALCLKLDRRLAGLAKKRKFTYTRYADDLTFSGSATAEEVQKLRHAVTWLIKSEGFKINKKKTRIMRQSSRQQVTGVVVNKILGLSRQERRRLRAMAHRLKQAKQNGSLAAEQVAHLNGKAAFVSMLNPEHGAQLRQRCQFI
jgi:RNA-directed DNA polymerase